MLKYYMLGAQVKRVESTNKPKVNLLIEKGFEEVEFKDGEVIKVNKVEKKDYDKLLAENKRLKNKIKKLEEQLKQ